MKGFGHGSVHGIARQLTVKGLLLVGLCVVAVSSLSGCTTNKEEVQPTNQGTENSHRIEWKVQTGGKITSSPVLASGRVYVGSDDQKLYAVDQDNGHIQWTFQADSPIRSTPQVTDKSIFVTSNAGTLYAIDPEKGKTQWMFHTDVKQGTLDEWDYYDSSPLVEGKDGQKDQKIYFGSADGNLYAVRAADGQKLWSFHAGAPIKSSPVLDDKGVYIGDWSGKLYGVDKQTGQGLWSYQTPPNGRHVAIQSNPVVQDGTVYWGCRNFTLVAVDSITGQLKWSLNEPAWAASPALLDGVLYVGNSNGYFMQAVDSASGQEKWRFNTVSNVLAAPALAGGIAYFGSGYAYHEEKPRQEYLYAIDLATGHEKWKLPTNKVQSTPAVDDHRVYYTSFDGYLYAVSLE